MRKRDASYLQRLRESTKKDAVPYFDIPSIDGREGRPPHGEEAYRRSVDSVLAKARAGGRRETD